jgi:predicted kinase
MHQLAEALGLQSRSEGKDDKRHLIITVTRATIANRGGGETAEEDTGRIFSHANELDEDGRRASSRKGPGKRQFTTVKDPAIFESLTFANIAQRKEVDAQADSCAGSLLVDDAGNTSIMWHRTLTTPAQELFQRRLEGDDSAQRLVVLLRGLPGSGKSTVAAMLSAADHDVVVCSADKFFEEGAGKLRRRAMKGMTTQEVYLECFDRALLPKAHAACKDHFCAALADGVATIIVDNTNTCTAEFTTYLDLAAAADVPVAVVELQCESLGELTRRGQHQVPADAMRRMRARWTDHPDAIRLRSQNATAAAAGPGPAIGVRTWLEQHHCYHLNQARPRTHIQFAMGGEPLSFVTVHPSRHDEFTCLYAAELDARRDGRPENPLYLAEERGDEFRFFVDLDAVSHQPLSDHDLAMVVTTLQRLVHETFGLRAPVLVTGAGPETVQGGIKVGRHLHCPTLVVATDAAQRLRSELVAALSLACEDDGAMSKKQKKKSKRKQKADSFVALDDHSIDWGQAVDAAVYHASGATLRKFGSRKVKKYRDLGPERIHRLLAVFGGDGRFDAAAMARYESDTVALLRDLSIRCSSEDDAETPATGVALVRTKSAEERERRVAAETEARQATLEEEKIAVELSAVERELEGLRNQQKQPDSSESDEEARRWRQEAEAMAELQTMDAARDEALTAVEAARKELAEPSGKPRTRSRER